MADESLIVRIGADIADFSKKMGAITEEIGGIGKESSQGALSIGKLAGALGLVTLAHKGIQMVGDAIGQAFSRIDTMEQFERVMSTLTGSTETANEVLDTVNDTVTGTAYGLDVAARATQNFVTSGMEITKATDSIASWGDAVAFYGDGSNETFNSVADALSKMTSKGKVDMEQMNRLTEAGIPAMQIYADATGQSVQEVSDQMGKGALSADDFTTVMNDALTNGTDKFAGIGGAAKEAGASWGASFDNMRAAVARGVTSIIESIDEMLTQNGLPDMRSMVSEFGSMFESVLTKIGTFIPPVISGLISVYENLKPWIPLIQAVLIAFGSLLTIVSVMNTVKSAFAKAKLAVLAFNATFLANPFILVIAALIGLAFLIYKYWDEIVAVTKAVWSGIKEFMGTLWEGIKTVFFTALESITSFLTTAWENIKTVTSNVWTAIVETVMNIISPFIEQFMTIWNNMKDGIFTIFEGIKMYFEGAWEFIKNLFLGALLLLLNLVTGNFDEMKSNAIGIWENLKNAFGMIWEGISTIFSGALQAVWGFVKGTWQNIKTNTSNVFNAVKTLISTIWNSIKSFFTTTLTSIWRTVVQKFKDIVNSIKQKMNDVVKRVKSGWKTAQDFLTGIDLKKIGKDIIQGLINGIKDKVKGVINAVKDVTDAITGKISSILGLGSPSRVLRDIGKDTGQGLVNGLKSMLSKVSSMAGDLAERAIVQPDSDIDIGYNTPNRIAVAGRGTLESANDQNNGFGGGSDSHVHYWNIDAEEISDVQQLIGVIDGVVQSVRSR